MYKYKWRYNDNERPIGKCYDCGLQYGEFPDMIIPDDLWELINPTRQHGAGLLCPTCIANRLDIIGLWYETKLITVSKKLIPTKVCYDESSGFYICKE